MYLALCLVRDTDDIQFSCIDFNTPVVEVGESN